MVSSSDINHEKSPSCSSQNLLPPANFSNIAHWTGVMYEKPVPPQSPLAISRIERTILELILWVSFTTPLVLLQLRYESIKGSLVPTVIFKGLPSIFQGFLVSVTLAFTGAFNALMLNDQSPLTTSFIYLSMASMATAVILLVWALSVQLSTTG